MPYYRVTIREETYRSELIEAESEDDARTIAGDADWRSWAYDDDLFESSTAICDIHPEDV